VLKSSTVLFRDPSGGRRGSPAKDVAAVSALRDPVRAAVLAYVVAAGSEVTRDQTAAKVGISRRAAAFHLDRLAREGWLDVTFRRVTGRSGPGAGRSSKLYRRSDRRIELSIPARNYELMARVLMAGALTEGRGFEDRYRPAAYAFGKHLGESVQPTAGGRSRVAGLRRALEAELDDLGFEPFVDEQGTLHLRNCPFHELAREDSDHVCVMNLALMQGVAEGLGVDGVTPALEPREGYCCVAFHIEERQAAH
jgi:predicted ArsR family transcriptional regulator